MISPTGSGSVPGWLFLFKIWLYVSSEIQYRGKIVQLDLAYFCNKFSLLVNFLREGSGSVPPWCSKPVGPNCRAGRVRAPRWRAKAHTHTQPLSFSTTCLVPFQIARLRSPSRKNRQLSAQILKHVGTSRVGELTSGKGSVCRCVRFLGRPTQRQEVSKIL